MKGKLSLTLGLLGLVATLVLVPAQIKALSSSDNGAANRVQAGETLRLKGKGQAAGQQLSAGRKATEVTNRLRFAARFDNDGSGFRNNKDCPQDPADCVPVRDGTGKQNGAGAGNGGGRFRNNEDCPQDPADCVPAQDGTGRQNGAGADRGGNRTDCPNPDGTRTPRRDGTGNPRR